MANIKPFISILSTAPLLLTSLQSMAADESQADITPVAPIAESHETIETNLIKSPFSFDFIGLQSDQYSSSGGRFGLSYQPNEDVGVVTNVSLEHFSNLTYKLNGSVFESEFTNLRWSAGYKFDVTNDFNITPSLGLVMGVITNTTNTNITQGYTNLRFAYDVNDSFSLFMEGNYDFGSIELPETSSFGIGFKYTPHYSQPIVAITSQEPTIIQEPVVSDFDAAAPILPDSSLETSAVTGVIVDAELGNSIEDVEIVEDAIDSADYESMRYTIQIGVFNNMAAANSFLQKNSISKDETYTREYNGLVKIYYKGFDALSSARQSLTSLKAKGVDGFVLNTPKKVNKTFVAIGTFYAVQLGSFSSLSSADPIITKMQGLDKKTFIKQSGSLMKLYTGKFQNKSEAQAELRKLKSNNIDGFVIKIN